MPASFSQCSLREIYDWYNRLIGFIETNTLSHIGYKPLAASLLEYYLHPETRTNSLNTKYENNQPYYEIQAQQLDALKHMQEVKYRLRYEYREVFLSKIVIPHTGAKGGIGPRLAGVKEYECDEHGNYIMKYTGRYIEIYPTDRVRGLVDKIKKHERISPEDETNLDFYLSLHKFGLDAFVAVTAMPVEISVPGQQLDQMLQIPKWKIQFVKWENTVDDTYDFNENVGIWLPNPDFRRTEQWAIAPNKEFFEFWELRHNYLANEFVK